MTADALVERLMDYFKVTTLSELANHINVKQPAISKWRTNNSISAIKKQCKLLGIYHEIFGDEMAKNVQKNYNNYGNNSLSGDINVNTPLNNNSILLTLDNDLLQKLKTLAEKEFRPLDMQIKKLLVEALERK